MTEYSFFHFEAKNGFQCIFYTAPEIGLYDAYIFACKDSEEEGGELSHEMFRNIQDNKKISYEEAMEMKYFWMISRIL